MGCNFNIGFNEPIETLLERAKKGIESNGGSFNGNANNGNYSIPTPLGKVVGNYRVNNKTIMFEITDKPFLVSCSKIEDELRKQLNNSNQSLT